MEGHTWEDETRQLRPLLEYGGVSHVLHVHTPFLGPHNKHYSSVRSLENSTANHILHIYVEQWYILSSCSPLQGSILVALRADIRGGGC